MQVSQALGTQTIGNIGIHGLTSSPSTQPKKELVDLCNSLAEELTSKYKMCDSLVAKMDSQSSIIGGLYHELNVWNTKNQKCASFVELKTAELNELDHQIAVLSEKRRYVIDSIERNNKSLETIKMAADKTAEELNKHVIQERMLGSQYVTNVSAIEQLIDQNVILKKLKQRIVRKREENTEELPTAKKLRLDIPVLSNINKAPTPTETKTTPLTVMYPESSFF